MIPARYATQFQLAYEGIDAVVGTCPTSTVLPVVEIVPPHNMFEKSLYDLIRGLRNHKGNERGYIQHSLRECRSEIKGPDMDLKATALLKLIYLEMFGHDMSWASFHVLEVMSCQKYLQKRVGYLAAAQSFRPDTEVLMLSTNLLKKDVSSSLTATLSLPLVTLPHIITSSLANSLLSDLLPRLSHSSPSVRKKTAAALYRLALVYPDTLRSAWPKLKGLLMDDEQDSSVTAAIVNVVCELSWRRPREFLALAPRLFDLLVDGGNNWMAIKIIKLFATLTPLEPRLVKKLLPPLTNLIRTTSAMSLLYECINGIIQGGILEGSDGAREGEEIASLCVGKLRGMIVVDEDPNLKYVALLAFKKIVESHPHLVSMQQDVILSCIDDPDISIRLQALDLGTGMVNNDNLMTVIERLMQQLLNAPVYEKSAVNTRSFTVGVEPAADCDNENPEEKLKLSKDSHCRAQAMPAEYRISIIHQIIRFCSKDNYANLIDFEWYIDILVQLVKSVPLANARDFKPSESSAEITHGFRGQDASLAIGQELQNVAVRVDSIRTYAVRAAQTLIATPHNSNATLGGEGALGIAAWVVGEYIEECTNPYAILDSLIHPIIHALSAKTLCAYLQAIPKVLSCITSGQSTPWTVEWETMLSLVIRRVIRVLEVLIQHPDLDVQERSVEFLELMRLTLQAISSYQSHNDQVPLLFTKAIPGLFTGADLKAVAPSAQKKVPIPLDLDLDSPLNTSLPSLLQDADFCMASDTMASNFESIYNEKPIYRPAAGPAIDRLASLESGLISYQQSQENLLDAEGTIRKRLERRTRNMGDPFYILGEDASSGTSTPVQDILRGVNGETVDVDSIPIISLDIGDKDSMQGRSDAQNPKHKRRRPPKVEVAQDETLGDDGGCAVPSQVRLTEPLVGIARQGHDKTTKSLLGIDTSGLNSLSLDDVSQNDKRLRAANIEVQDPEMAKALAEVERLRLEMQRASERIHAEDGTPAEGTIVTRKKKRKIRLGESDKNGKSVAQKFSGTEQDSYASLEMVNTDAAKKKKKKKRKKTANETTIGQSE